jgi:hypothetical protein
MIRHQVFIRYPADTRSDTKVQILADLAGLRTEIDGILDFQHRNNISPETPVVRGFTDMFWFDFAHTDVRDKYLANANHRAIGGRLVDACGGVDGIFVCDIEM